MPEQTAELPALKIKISGNMSSASEGTISSVDTASKIRHSLELHQDTLRGITKTPEKVKIATETAAEPLLGTSSPNRPLTREQAGRWLSATTKAERNAEILKLRQDAKAAGEAFTEFTRKGNVLEHLKADTENYQPIIDEGRIRSAFRRKADMVKKNYWEITGGIQADIIDIKNKITGAFSSLVREK